MSENDVPLPLIEYLADFLSDVTRSERRVLLGVCAIGLAIAWIGLTPSGISVLGIEFHATNQRTILNLVSVVIAYFFFEFLIHATKEYLAWGTKKDRVAMMSELRRIAGEQEMQRIINKIRKADSPSQLIEAFRIRARYYERFRRGDTWALKPIRWVQVFADLIFPVVLAPLTISFLLAARPPAH